MLVAEHGSFRDAAERLGRSASAVSAQIKQLEQQLGVCLFQRTTRSVRLSEAGEELFASAGLAVERVSLSISRIRESSERRATRVNMGCLSSFSATFLPSVISAFAVAQPHVSVSVQELTTADLLGAVRSGLVDFAVGSDGSEPDLAYESILHDPFVALVPAGFFPHATSTISLQELVTGRLLLLHPSCVLRAILDKEIEVAGLRKQAEYEFSHAQTVVQMVEAGLGPAIVPGSSLRKVPERTARVLSLLPDVHREVAIIQSRARPVSAAAARLRLEIARTVKGAAGGDRRIWAVRV
jgi:LysR family carnitine catabolism transcriptional activator